MCVLLLNIDNGKLIIGILLSVIGPSECKFVCEIVTHGLDIFDI